MTKAPSTNDIAAARLRAAREDAGLSRPAFIALLAQHGYEITIHALTALEIRRVHAVDVDLVITAGRALGISATHLLGLTNPKGRQP